jgi:hypothetical protein
VAVRISASGQDFSRALALGSLTALTAAFWWKVSVDRNTYSSAFFVDNGQADNWGVQTGVDGTTANIIQDGTSTASVAMTVGTWYFGCLALSGSTGTFYYKAAGSAALSTTAITGVTATNAATLRLGESPWGAEWLNGCLAAFKLWNAQLTADEVLQESTQYVPNRFSSLVSWHPLVKTELIDYSGNARTLSGGTGTATEDGPPIAWRGGSARLILPAATAASASGSASTVQRSSTTEAGAKAASGTGADPARTATVAAGLKVSAAAASSPVRQRTASAGAKAATGTAVGGARAMTSCAGFKGGASAGGSAQEAQTTSAGTKQTSGVGASPVRSLTVAGSSVGGAGRSVQRSATAATGVRGATGAGISATRPVAAGAGRKGALSSPSSAVRCTSAGAGRKGALAVGISATRATSLSTGVRTATGAGATTCRTSTGNGVKRAAAGSGLTSCRIASSSAGSSTPIVLRDLTLAGEISAGRFGGSIAPGRFSGTIEPGRWEGKVTW